MTKIDSVWLGTAILTYDLCKDKADWQLEDIYFSQQDIVDAAKNIIGNDVPNELVDQDSCAYTNSPNKNCMYIVAKDAKRRLTYTGEVSEKRDKPDFSQMADNINLVTKHGNTNVDALVQFVNKEYSPRIKQLLSQYFSKYKLETVFDYIKKYGNKNFIAIEKAGKQAQIMKEHKQDGTAARSIIKDFTAEIKSCIPRFSKLEVSGWVNQGQKTEGYIWSELRKKQKEELPSSISVFFEKISHNVGEEYELRISVEARDGRCVKDAESSAEEKYYRHDRLLNTSKNKKIQICKVMTEAEVRAKSVYEVFQFALQAFIELEPYYDEAVADVITIAQPEEGASEGGSSKVSKNFNRNMILYGPPGTGKTYNAAIYAVAICDGKSLQEVEDMGYEAVRERYNELMEKESRIAFTTFHQSYGYEEFIEGIRPVMDDEIVTNELQYKIVPGVFKAFCERAKEEKIQAPSLGIRENPVVWNVLLDGSGTSDLKKRCFDNDYIKIGWNNIEANITDQTEGISNQARNILINFQDEMQEGDVVFIQAHNTTIDGIAVIKGDYTFDEKDKFPRTRTVKWLAKNIEEDVFALNKNVRLDRKTVYPLRNMDVVDVMKLVEKFSKSSITVEKNENPYVFIIDEINRGNISKIFGELITLIEETKRLGEEEAMTAILPYSGEAHPFGVPNNLYILGTMNTADRSIALMDTALRRRFNFVEMMPKDELLRDVVVEKNGIAVNIQKLLKDLNIRIEFLFDREHTIGQAFFWGLKKEPTLEKLGEIFKKSIVPLLQEYFYDDYEKIQLVLGDTGKADVRYKFILSEEVSPNKIFRGRTNLDKEQKYKIQESAFDLIESYEGILNPEE